MPRVSSDAMVSGSLGTHLTLATTPVQATGRIVRGGESGNAPASSARGPGLHSAAQVAPGLREQLRAQARPPACWVDENGRQLRPCLCPRNRDITDQRTAYDHDELLRAGGPGAEPLGAHRPSLQRTSPQREHRWLVFGTVRAQLPLTESAGLPSGHAANCRTTTGW
jgi:hypothetical protein